MNLNRAIYCIMTFYFYSLKRWKEPKNSIFASLDLLFSGSTFKAAQLTGAQSSSEFHEGEGASPGLVHPKRGGRIRGCCLRVDINPDTALHISLAQAHQGNPGHLQCWIWLCAAFTFPPRPCEKGRVWDTALLHHIWRELSKA